MTGYTAFVDYWPASAGPFWWSAFDFQETTWQFDVLCEFRLKHVRISLTWDDFAASGTRVSVRAMRQLEQVLRVAADRGMSLVPTLFPVRIMGVTCLPELALGDEPNRGVPILTGQSTSRRSARNVFLDERVVQAELALIREVVNEFSDHPAVAGWILGDGMHEVSAAGTADAFFRWLERMADILRQVHVQRPVWHGMSAHSLAKCQGADPTLLADFNFAVWLDIDWCPVWCPAEPGTWAHFLTAYVGRLAGSSPIVRLSRLDPRMTDHTFFANAEASSRNVYAGGGAGFELSHAFDFAPPVQRAWSLEGANLGTGLFTTRGQPRATDLIRALSDQDGSRAEQTPQFTIPDFPPRDRDPEGAMRECFESLFR